ncbi:MAG TPA: hypothetical protein VHR66_00605 [Gemmataceae bacterium]|nr:hypothetical protein [Gemmataceae bacterium]
MTIARHADPDGTTMTIAPHVAPRIHATMTTMMIAPRDVRAATMMMTSTIGLVRGASNRTAWALRP